MTTEEDKQARAYERLLGALKKLNVFSRIDGDGRVLASDGRLEHEVTVDLNRLLSTGAYGRKIAVGTSSLDGLERGEVTELFPRGIVAAAVEAQEATDSDAPVSPHYAPLTWDLDGNNLDDDDALVAEGEDWTYYIQPVRGSAGEVVGYYISGGDIESGDDFGYLLIGGKVGELTLDKAKTSAQADYASRYREAEQFLDSLLSDWENEHGHQTRRNEQGRIVCPVEEAGTDEVEVVVTLQDYGDGYDTRAQRVSLCLRTLLRFSGDGDPDGLVDEIGRLILREARSSG